MASCCAAAGPAAFFGAPAASCSCAAPHGAAEPLQPAGAAGGRGARPDAVNTKLRQGGGENVCSCICCTHAGGLLGALHRELADARAAGARRCTSARQGTARACRARLQAGARAPACAPWRPSCWPARQARRPAAPPPPGCAPARPPAPRRGPPPPPRARAAPAGRAAGWPRPPCCARRSGPQAPARAGTPCVGPRVALQCREATCSASSAVTRLV